MDADTYGPALPPGFKQKAPSDDSTVHESKVKSDVIGPQLPSEFATQKDAVNDEDEDNQSSDSDSKAVIGPALPARFSSSQSPGDTDSDSDSVYGPLPAPNHSDSVDSVIETIEKRATDMKKKLQGIDQPVDNAAKREEWMTLPATDYRNQFGIISRCLVGDSQPKSSKKQASKISVEEAHHSARNEHMKEELEKYNKNKRSESLLELHKKSKKRRKDEESKKPMERKAFDRDAELGVRLMDQRQVNSVLRNAKKLNSRFASGASAYL